MSKGVAYPIPADTEAGSTHQIDLVGPRHLFGGVDLLGKRITVAEDQTHQYVTAIIRNEVRTKRVIVITLDGQVIHDGDYSISRILR